MEGKVRWGEGRGIWGGGSWEPLHINHNLSPTGTPWGILQRTLESQRTQFENHFANESKVSGRCSIVVFKLKTTGIQDIGDLWWKEYLKPALNLQILLIIFKALGFVWVCFQQACKGCWCAKPEQPWIITTAPQHFPSSKEISLLGRKMTILHDQQGMIQN